MRDQNNKARRILRDGNDLRVRKDKRAQIEH